MGLHRSSIVFCFGIRFYCSMHGQFTECWFGRSLFYSQTIHCSVIFLLWFRLSFLFLLHFDFDSVAGCSLFFIFLLFMLFFVDAAVVPTWFFYCLCAMQFYNIYNRKQANRELHRQMYISTCTLLLYVYGISGRFFSGPYYYMAVICRQITWNATHGRSKATETKGTNNWCSNDMRKSNSRKINYPFSKIFNSKQSFTQLLLNAPFFTIAFIFFWLPHSLLFFWCCRWFCTWNFFFIAETKNSQNTRYTNRIYIKTITTKKLL